jgi:hypothetical protein
VQGVPTVEEAVAGPGGGRTWWAHFEFTRINIALTILEKKIEDLREAGAFGHFTNVERIRSTVRGLRIRAPFSALSIPIPRSS